MTKTAATSKRRRNTTTVGAMITAGDCPKPLSVRTVAVFCSRKKVTAKSPALCSIAEVFPLKKSSALTLAETKDTMTLYRIAGKFGRELNLVVWRPILQPPN